MKFNPDIPNHSPEDEKEFIVLPIELSRYISAEQIGNNVKNYPEMTMKLTKIQRERINCIKDVLIQIPLIHATPNDEIAMGSSGLSPMDDLPVGHRGHSLKSDRSLGLTKYVFFNWGMAQKGYGRFIAQYSPELLEGDNVIVTPMDFGHIELADERLFDDYEPERKKRMEDNYLKYMVTGRTWKEIVARRILKSIESGHPFFPLSTSYSLGEIKHLGGVPKEHFIGSFPVSDMRAHYRFLYEHGFSFTNMEQKRMLYQRTGKKYGVDPSHEECGIDYEEAGNFWKRILGMQ
jgi:hypothetical protein